MQKTAHFDHLTQAALAKMHAVTARTVRNWDSEGHPKNSDGTYQAAASIRWLIDREAHDGLDLNGERAALARQQTINMELKNRRTKGEVVSLAMIERLVGHAMTNFRTVAMGIPSKLAPRLEGLTAPEIKAAIEFEVRRLLEHIANFDFTSFDETVVLDEPSPGMQQQ